MLRTRKQTWPTSTVIAVTVCASGLSACVAHQPVSPEEFAVWTRQRFPPVLLSKIQDGTIRFDGGDGHSYEAAVVIVGAAAEPEGVTAEYFYISRKHGVQGRDWRPIMQALSEHGGRRFDVLTVSVASEWGDRVYYFDISDFFGKGTGFFGMKDHDAGH